MIFARTPEIVEPALRSRCEDLHPRPGLLTVEEPSGDRANNLGAFARVHIGRAMRIASINVNKGLNSDRRILLEEWLGVVEPSVLLLQEPTSHSAAVPERLGMLEVVVANSEVAAYAMPGAAAAAELIEERWLRYVTGGRVLDNVYFPHENKTPRKELLTRLSERSVPNRVIVGDFNMAPRPEDGRYGAKESEWTGVQERAAFLELLRTGLVDLGATDAPEFTFERRNHGKWNRFRCDLAVVSESVAAVAALSVDHAVRDPDEGFTDHSALIVEIEE